MNDKCSFYDDVDSAPVHVSIGWLFILLFFKKNFHVLCSIKICHNNLLQSSRVLMNLKGSRLKIPLKRSKNC